MKMRMNKKMKFKAYKARKHRSLLGVNEDFEGRYNAEIHF